MMSRSEKRNRPLLLKVMYHPMFYASLVLHGLIFAIPGNPEPEVPPEVEAEDQEVEIVMLPPVIEPDPEITLEEPETPPEPDVAVPRPDPKPQPQNTPPPPSEPPSSDAPPAPPDDKPEEPEAPAPGSPYNPTGDRQRLRRLLSDITTQMSEGRDRTMQVTDQTPDSGVVNPLLFKRSSKGDYFTDDDQPRRGIIGMNVLSNASEAQLLPRLQESYDLLGYDFSAIGTGYGGGSLYELKSPEGELVGYLNFAPTSSPGASTILVWWDYNPNEPPPEPTPSS